MAHTPLGYQIENGEVVIDEAPAERVRTLFSLYLSGASLNTAAKKSGIQTFHGSIGNMLRNTRYLGDDFYPSLIDPDIFDAVQEERLRRVENLGRVFEPKEENVVLIPTAFRMNECTQTFEDPFRQSEYLYSLIEWEEPENG